MNLWWLQRLRRLAGLHLGLTLSLMAILGVGVMFVYSACYISPEQPVRTLYLKQMVWALVGLMAYLGIAQVDYRALRKLAVWLYLGGLILLLLVLLLGTQVYGARRWLMLFGVTLQPAEPAKLATVMFLAVLLSRQAADLNSWKYVIGLLLLMLLPMALILKQPDLGTALIFLPLTMVLLMVAGVSWRILGTLAGAGLAVVLIVLTAVLLPEHLEMSDAQQVRILRMVGMNRYQKDRIVSFLHPERDPLGMGWNKIQSEIAIGSGGVWGKGFRNGTQNILGFLPRSVAPTDFIYSVIAEEKGFVGSISVLGLFALLLACCTQVALRARDRFGRLLCSGVAALIFWHVFINIAMTVGVLPITGLPLPLVSYGGSFMVVTMSALGIVQSVHLRSPEHEMYV